MKQELEQCFDFKTVMCNLAVGNDLISNTGDALVGENHQKIMM